MTQRAWIDAMRCLIYTNAAAIDRSKRGSGAEAEAARELAELYIPLSKGLCTDVGNEMTSLAVQIHGGMGFVEETGIAQHYRDIRIAAIYEGTNGIQAADLVGRKLPMRGGAVVAEQLTAIDAVAAELAAIEDLKGFGQQLEAAVAATRRATEWLLTNAPTSPNSALAASSPYMRMLGTVVCGGLLGRSALVAGAHADDPTGFYAAKRVSARFFGEQILPLAAALEPAVTAGADDLFALSPSQLR